MRAGDLYWFGRGVPCARKMIMRASEKQNLQYVVNLMSDQTDGNCREAWELLCRLAGFTERQPLPPFDKDVLLKQSMHRAYRD